jgi:DNA polymerase-3 subunit beta
MKTEIKASDLMQTLAVVAPVVPSRSIIPALSQVRFGGNTISGTNLDIEVVADIAAMESGFEGAINARQLRNLIRYVPGDETITISGGDAVNVTFNGSNYRFGSQIGDNPVFGNNAEVPNWGKCHNIDLIAALRGVGFAASSEHTRYYLNGVYFEADGDGTLAVATDGRMLASWRMPAVEALHGRIVPSFAVDYMLSRKVSPDEIGTGEKYMRAKWPGITMSSRLIDGTYPNWRRVVPAAGDQWFTIDIATWRLALTRIYHAHQGASAKPVKFKVGSGEASLSGTFYTFERIDWKETLPVILSANMGKMPEFGFSAAYLLLSLNAFRGCETVTMFVSGPSDPALMVADNHPLSITIMPMRV